jgi:glycosyltransferase involved in cell wall biosynthesis
LCAIEQAALCRDAFDGVTVVMNQAGPLVERIQRLGLEHVLLPVEYRGLRSGGLAHFLRHVWTVVASRIRYVAGLKRRLKQYPGILHVHSRVLCGMHACLAGRWAGVPVVLTLHEPPARHRLKARFDAWWIRYCVDEVVAASAATAAEYRQYLKNRNLHVVHYCMVKLPEVREFSRPGKPVVAFIGLVARKRYADFLEACRILTARGVGFEAWLVGAWDTPEDQARAGDFIARHALGDVVVNKGLIQDMDALYRAIAVIAAPSEPVEALPRVVMEGMCHGIPVVATRVNGVPEMVVDGETGFLIDVGAPECLADRLERLLRDPALREQMGRAGRTRAEKLFSPERFRNDMLAIYRGMVRDG